jgi:hypothetical protein
MRPVIYHTALAEVKKAALVRCVAGCWVLAAPPG